VQSWRTGIARPAMTAETPHTPQAGIAKALTDLSDQSRVLVKSEIDSPLRET